MIENVFFGRSRRGLAGVVLLTFVVWMPLPGVPVSSGPASVLGCPLNRGGTHPCLRLGRDIGDPLHTLFVLGWLMRVTAPLMLMTALLWAGLVARWGRRQLRDIGGA